LPGLIANEYDGGENISHLCSILELDGRKIWVELESFAPERNATGFDSLDEAKATTVAVTTTSCNNISSFLDAVTESCYISIFSKTASQIRWDGQISA
jgi:hypothetical protein